MSIILNPVITISSGETFKQNLNSKITGTLNRDAQKVASFCCKSHIVNITIVIIIIIIIIIIVKNSHV